MRSRFDSFVDRRFESPPWADEAQLRAPTCRRRTESAASPDGSGDPRSDARQRHHLGDERSRIERADRMWHVGIVVHADRRRVDDEVESVERVELEAEARRVGTEVDDALQVVISGAVPDTERQLGNTLLGACVNDRCRRRSTSDDGNTRTDGVEAVVARGGRGMQCRPSCRRSSGRRLTSPR